MECCLLVILKDKIKSGLFAFKSAPGLKSLTFSAYGKVEVWIDGVKAEAIAGRIRT